VYFGSCPVAAGGGVPGRESRHHRRGAGRSSGDGRLDIPQRLPDLGERNVVSGVALPETPEVCAAFSTSETTSSTYVKSIGSTAVNGGGGQEAPSENRDNSE
jgi:hypothetical protein